MKLQLTLIVLLILVHLDYTLRVHGNISLTNMNYLLINPQFALIICDIIQKEKAQLNIIYANDDITAPGQFINDKINWTVLQQCLGNLPHVVSSLGFLLIEPRRHCSSLNIFFVTSANIAQRIADFIDPQQRNKHIHRYLLICFHFIEFKLSDFFQLLWQKNILHAVAAVDSQHVYTFEPFSKHGFRLRLIEQKKGVYFYDKLKNFHHSPVRISMFTEMLRALPLADHYLNGYRGVDGWLARTLAERLNATALYVTPTDDKTYGYYENGTFTGSFKDIYMGRAHINCNLRYTKDSIKEYFEELYPYRWRVLSLVVPAAKMRPMYLSFVYAFSGTLWGCVLLNFMAVLILFRIFLLLVPQMPNQLIPPMYYHWYELFELFLKMQIQQDAGNFPRLSSLRQFLMSWIIFSYLLTSIYLAKLSSNFIRPAYEDEINHLSDLNRLKVPIYAYRDVFEAAEEWLQPQIYQMIMQRASFVPTHINDNEFSLRLAQTSKNVALLTYDQLSEQIFKRSYDAETKRYSYHIVKEYLHAIHASYIMTKGSPFTHKFETIVSAFYEYGFIDYWTQMDSQKETTQVSQTEMDDQGVVLSVDILQGAFFIWLIGITMSCLVFVLEHWCWRRSSRRH